MNINRIKFYMVNDSAPTVDIDDRQLAQFEAGLAKGPVGQVSFPDQRGQRLGSKLTIGINFAHVISWTVEKL